MRSKRKKTNLKLQGIGVSPGIVIGKALLVERGKIEISTYPVNSKKEIEKEISTLLNAMDATRDQLLETKENIQKKGYKEAIFIINAYLMILEDKMLIEETINYIRKEKVNAAWALKNTLKNLQKVFSEIEDNYLRERKNDVDYVVKKILYNLTSRKKPTDMKKVVEKVIIASHDLSPTDTLHLDLDKVLGFVTDIGGKTSHTAIMARALEIPAVIGLKTATEQIKDGDIIVTDGVSGSVIINPTKKVFDGYLEKKEKYHHLETELLKFKPLPSETSDGHEVKLLANIEITGELPSIIHHGAEGIGLYRTEFLYLDKAKPPTEEDHFQTYRKVIEKISPYSTTIRTFDLGGDKFISPLSKSKALNPVMGLRAIRFCLREVEFFKTQIRAILRASALGKVRILFPMISGMEEIFQINDIISDVKDELKAKEVAFDPKIEVGAMIETPSAAIIADLLAKEVDFFSIGTNDLIQYILAIDRVNEHVAYLYKPLHPSILRMIKRTVEAAHAAGIKVTMCGEMAGEIFYAPILLGFGIDELSMNALSILKVKKVIRSFTYQESQQIVDKILTFNTAKNVESFLQKKIAPRVLEEFPEWEGVD